ncbi:peptidoglycan-binding protein [Methanobrevibacter sp.]|uniref:peptidoglycan-binding protein n=1 Tax=Methanobrevibacter sp. TaxID=66852 RepID=UPI00388D3D27
MEYKKTIILLALVVFLLSIAGVSASEIGDTIASENANTIELSADNDIEDNLQTSEENEALASTDYDEAIAQTDTEVLGADSATYSDLANEISQPGNITLTHKNYTYDKDATAIDISEDNKVIDGNGAVIDMTGSNIRAFYVSASGVTIKNLTIINANYDGDGGAIYFTSSGTVSNCNFADNTATGSGGAVYFNREGAVTKCNFTDNYASTYGGAVFFQSTGNVTNCSFTDNKATGDNGCGGAVYFLNPGNVTNCNFTGNTATYYGGAVNIGFGTVSNCNFADNTAYCGGAVYFFITGTVSNCNFTDNTAGDWGGAIMFVSTGTVSNCNFTGNNATTGSAINFYSTSSTKTVFNSRFLNNRANAEVLEITKNDNNITITFTGGNNLLNAIYSRNDTKVTFTNVTYWGANGITTVSATMAGSNKATGQNITVGVVVNNELVLSDVMDTDENGMIVLDISADDNYYISARHDADSYYTEAETTISNNTKFNANVTSQKTTNKTINITAESNIPNDVVKGKLLFILPNGTQIDATYGANGTWWAEHTFDTYGEYNVNATYVGLDNVTVNDGTITINKVNSTISLDNIVLDYGESTNVTITTTGATGITAKIDGNDVTVINNYNIQISGLKAGNHTLTVTTIPDDDHNPVTATSKITVNKVKSTLTVDDIVFDYGSEGSGNVSFAGASEVIANVVSQPNAVVSVNGKKITVSGLAAGTYTLNVTTVPDENHTAVTETATITVNKVNSTLTLDDVELDYGESINVTVSCEGATGIDAKIDGVNVAVDAYTISISDLSAGTHTLTVATVPDENHTAVTKTATITVNKVSTNLTAAGVTATYKVNKYLVIKLTDGQGNPLANATVTVDLNGVKNYTTDENGQIKIKVSNMVPKTYSAKISYAGNDNYIGSNVTAKVVVKKATPKITASAKTFKTATKTKKYTITLKDNTGKAIKNAKVTLKVNGKTYKATTNSKGKATFKITKLTKKGTFKATITYTGNKYYNKVTKKANIKVISSWKTISKGSKDKSTVREIQQALKNHGYYLTAYGHYLMVDGKFQSCTERSVKEFQKDKGLKVTGKVDENTAKKLGLI